MARIWAAILAAGTGAAASHATAAELIGLVAPADGPIHVSIPHTRRVQPLDGVVVHHSRRVRVACHPSRVPPQTRVEETVLDLADIASDADRAIGWCVAACARRLTTSVRLAQALGGRPRIRWRSQLAEALTDIADGCHSTLEIRYLRDVERRHALPKALRQVRHRRLGGSIYNDVEYAEYGAVVELDGQNVHLAEGTFRDLDRDNVNGARGDVVLHYGWADVTKRPCDVAQQVANVLRMRGWADVPKRCGVNCMIV